MSESQKEKQSINDIDMDHFSTSNNRLETTRLNSCIGFIVILNNGEHIFVEHRTDINLPTALNLDSVRPSFKNLSALVEKYGPFTHCFRAVSHSKRPYKAKLRLTVIIDPGEHIDRVLLYENITDIIMLGEHGNKQRLKNLQRYINQLIDIQFNATKDVDLNEKTNEKINHYEQLFTNVICNDICFNLAPETETIAATTGEAFLDLIVDKNMGNGERLVIVVQRVAKFNPGQSSPIVNGHVPINYDKKRQVFTLTVYDDHITNNNLTL